jgi:7-keto-8-aminopelargonate synthetase-like enzyme
MNTSTLQTMKEAKRWLLRNGKVPFYATSLTPRSATDTAEDCAKLVTHAEAIQQLKQHQQNGKANGFELGFALGPDESGTSWLRS